MPKHAGAMLLLFLFGVVVSIAAVHVSTSPLGLVLLGIVFFVASLVVLPTVMYLLAAPVDGRRNGIPIMFLTGGTGVGTRLHADKRTNSTVNLYLFLYCAGLVLGVMFASGLL